MTGFISSSLFQNTKRFPQIQSLAPGIARRSSGWFQLRRRLRRAITPNPCFVCQIRGYRCVHLVEGFVAACSVRWLDPRIAGNRRISSWLRQGSSSPVRTSIVVARVSSCSLFSHLCKVSLTLPSPSPAAAPLPPPFPLPDDAPFSLLAAAAAPRAPCAAAPAPGSASPCAAPPLSLPSLFHGWEEEDEERKNTMVVS
jgi:hypothetical protein